MHQSAGRERETSREGEGKGEGFSVMLLLVRPNCRAHTQAVERTHAHTETCILPLSGRGCGSREQSGVSVPIFPSAQIKYIGWQLKMMSLSHSCPYRSVLRCTMCVYACVKSSAEVKLDTPVPFSLSLLNSVFSRDSGDPTGSAESYGLDQVPSVSMKRTCTHGHKHECAHMHGLQS